VSEVLDSAWMDTVLRGARPRAMGALLRSFGDLDAAEEAFQEACLKALERWPKNGPPRDPAAWIVLVARNSGIDSVRRRRRETGLVDDDLADPAAGQDVLVDRLSEVDYRDDVLRLLFICCHPELPATQQLALALRLVCGLSIKQIARAFLVSEAAMAQRITRAKSRVAAARLPFESPATPDREGRLATVAAAIYLLFSEGYSATGGEVPLRAPLCEEAIRLARVLLGLFRGEPGLMGLLALMLLQHARAPARLDADGNIVLLEEQDRTRWDRGMIAEGLALLDKAGRHRRPDPYQLQAAIAAQHARAARAEETNWAEIERLYAVLEELEPSPVITLNRAVAVAKLRGPAEALALIEPLAAHLSGYFYFFGLRGALLEKLGRPADARAAFERAIVLANTAAEAAHIRMQLDRLMNGA
jgi:RNA polymerase sigma-70 factor, ECF subfamily